MRVAAQQPSSEHRPESTVPLVAIVGRPNVGKSTLFNRLVGARLALVEDVPGVTRDRIEATWRLPLTGSRDLAGSTACVQLVDTAGFTSTDDDPFASDVKAQTLVAAQCADAVLWVVDGTAPIHPDDTDLVAVLRRLQKPVLLVANKIDSSKKKLQATEIYRLGLPQVALVSAAHDLNMEEICTWTQSTLDLTPYVAPKPCAQDLTSAAARPLRVALVGRPNAGKSALVNALCGQARLLTTDIPGTTRDSVDVPVQLAGTPAVLVDTAGLRRQSRIGVDLERLSVMRAVRALERADVVCLVLDAACDIAQQDARIAQLICQRGKGVVLVLNKWDLVAGDACAQKRLQMSVQHKLRHVDFAVQVRTQAVSGKGCSKLEQAIIKAAHARHTRVSTGLLNRFFRTVVQHKAPPAVRGVRPKLLYVAQPQICPPTFVFSASHPEHIGSPYKRFLQSCLREHFALAGTPVWLKFRDRRRARNT